jgi:hypothetical protein
MLRVYMGFDPRDTLAFEVAAFSLRRHASIPVEIKPLKDWELRARGLFSRTVWINEAGQRFDGRDGVACSTEFSYLRFLVPALEGFAETWVLFTDPDVLWRADAAELLALIEPDKAIMCVKHDHRPREAVKMTGTLQRHYARKNWSSLMLLRPAANRALTRYRVNMESKDWLHQLAWLADEEIGALPEAWNWLAGWSPPEVEPKLVHFTRGTPDMPGHDDEAFAAEWRQALADSAADLAAFPRDSIPGPRQAGGH